MRVGVPSLDLSSVDRVKRRIIKLYREDIDKHAGRHARKVKLVFDGIPAQLNDHDKKFRLAALQSDARMRTYEDSFIWLREAMVANVSFNATEPNVGLSMSTDHTTLKCYLLDTGLLVSHTFSERVLVAEQIHSRILSKALEFNSGMMVENFEQIVEIVCSRFESGDTLAGKSFSIGGAAVHKIITRVSEKAWEIIEENRERFSRSIEVKGCRYRSDEYSGVGLSIEHIVPIKAIVEVLERHYREHPGEKPKMNRDFVASVLRKLDVALIEKSEHDKLNKSEKSSMPNGDCYEKGGDVLARYKKVFSNEYRTFWHKF